MNARHIPAPSPSALHNPDQPEGPLSEDEEEGDWDNGMYAPRRTNAITAQEHAGGCRLCQVCRPSDATIEERARQVFEFAMDCVQLHNITLNPHRRLHYGRLQARTRHRLRHMGMKCQCWCTACCSPGNGHRGLRDFTERARDIAHQDVNSFLLGELPELSVASTR